MLALQNWRAALLVVGLGLLWSGLALWSEALARVALGMVLVALSVLPSLLRRKESR